MSDSDESSFLNLLGWCLMILGGTLILGTPFMLGPGDPIIEVLGAGVGIATVGATMYKIGTKNSSE